MRILVIFLALSLHCTECVTCFLNGQLGNQMFQVAAAIGYALDHGLDARFPDIDQALGGKLNGPTVFRKLNRDPLPQGEWAKHQETHPNLYTPIPHHLAPLVKLFGHFESEKYFIRHQKVIRELFAPPEEIVQEIEHKYGHLFHRPTVAVHVRTFIPDGRDPRYVGIGGGTWDYFIQAMRLFPPKTQFLLFSDRNGWVWQHFPKEWRRKVTLIHGNSHIFDFYLMSRCDHQIISPESTFSWWAAWLNPNPNKKVIIPSVWNDLFPNDTIPPGWIVLRKDGRWP
jgi:hypothetical protein